MLPIERPSLVFLPVLLLLWVAPLRKSAPPSSFRPAMAGARSGRVWLRPAFRAQITSAPVSTLPDSAVTFVGGRSCYFVDEGDGWFRLRAAAEPPRAGERVVTHGAFLVKSELAR